MKSSWTAALRVAAGYVVVAFAWILVSDSVVALLPKDAEHVAQTLKGTLFVAVTGLTLYALLYRWAERISREARHAESAERALGRVVNTVPIGVLLLSGERRITYLNRGAEDLLGIRAGDVMGERVEELDLFADSFVDAAWEALLGTGATEDIVLGAAPHQRTIMGRSAVLDDGRADSGWVVALADVSDAHAAGERAARLVHGYRFLSEALVAAGLSADHKRMLGEVCRLAVEEGGFSAAWVLYRDSRAPSEDVSVLFGGGQHVAESARRLEREALPYAELTQRLAQGDVSVSNDAARDPLSPWAAAARAGEFGACAVLASVSTAGQSATLTLFAREPGYFDSDQVALLKVIRSSLAFAAERVVLDRKRQEAEERLARSEADYRSLFAGHPQPMWVYDLETLEFMEVNDAAVAKYGYSREEFLSMKISDIRPVEDIGRLLDNVAHVRDGFDDAGIWTHEDKRGRAFPVHIYSHALQWDGRRAELVMTMEVARVE